MTELLPAMGYGRKQMEELRETIERSDADSFSSDAIDLRRVIELDKPSSGSSTACRSWGEPTLAELLAERGII